MQLHLIMPIQSLKSKQPAVPSHQQRPQNVTFRCVTAAAAATEVGTAAEAGRVGIAAVTESLPPEGGREKWRLKRPGVAKSLSGCLELRTIRVLAAEDQRDSMILEEVVGLE